MTLRPIHPFPARMAPDIAQRSLEWAGSGGRIIDPMCGSGTVLRAAVERGLDCVGVDIDPLAVLMTKAWVTPVESYRIVHDAMELCRRAKAYKTAELVKPADEETENFIGYWFAPDQRKQLARLATALRRTRWPSRDLLSLAMSRVIVTKEMAASLARDTSHSRPHRVAVTNDYDVFAGFLTASRLIARRHQAQAIRGRAQVAQGDARHLSAVPDASFDMAVTSPPYLNAIDYMRGHRLTLVWLGYAIATLRDIRSTSVGAERGPAAGTFDVDPFILEPGRKIVAERHRRWLRRYAQDMTAAMTEMRRVVRPGGRVTIVVGNSVIGGATMDNAALIRSVATEQGMEALGRFTREIPARRRYLPPPRASAGPLDGRMRTEEVLSFGRP